MPIARAPLPGAACLARLPTAWPAALRVFACFSLSAFSRERDSRAFPACATFAAGLTAFFACGLAALAWGFAAFACEDIFRLAQLPTNPVSGAVPGLRPQRTEDWPALQKLCIAITPQRVRQVEGGIAVTPAGGRGHLGYVLPDQDPHQGKGSLGDDLVAALHVHIGKQAHWLRLLVHPDAGSIAGALIGWALTSLVGQPPRPVYCSVRQYEAGVRDALQAASFELDHARTLMVRQTIAWAKVPAQELVPALKGSAEPVFHSSSNQLQLSADSGGQKSSRQVAAAGGRRAGEG